MSKLTSHLYVYPYVESFIVSSMALVKTVNSWELEMLIKNIIRTHHNWNIVFTDSVQWVCFTEENFYDFRISVVSHEIITGLEFVPDTMISSFFHEKSFQLPHNKPATYYN